MPESMLSLVGPRKVRVSPKGVAAFNRQWPGSTLRASRAYWFEFNEAGDLIDTDCPEHDDGPAAAAMADACRAWLDCDESPSWSDDEETGPFEGDTSIRVADVRRILTEYLGECPMFREDNTDGFGAEDLALLNEAALTLVPLVGSLHQACQIVNNNWTDGGNTLATLTRLPIVRG